MVGLSKSTISNSHIINTDSRISSSFYAGSLVGYSSSSISNSYIINTDSRIYSSDYTGGLVGYSSSSISNSYVINTDSTIAALIEGYSGGLAGYSYSSISKSAVSWLGTNSLGGTSKGILVIFRSPTNSKYYIENSLNGDLAGGESNFVSKPNFYTNNENTSFIYNNWDFTNTWKFNTNNYPTLR